MTEPGGALLATTGMLPAIVLVSAALTAPVTLALLWIYRRAVVRSMRATGGGDRGASAAAAPVTPGAIPSLRIATVGGDDGARASPVLEHATRSLRRAVAIYVLAGLAYSAVMAGAWLIVSGDGRLPPARMLWLFTAYAWPIVLTVNIAAAISRRQRVVVTAVYGAALAAVALFALARNPDLTTGQLAFFWLYANGPSTALLAAFLQRRVRAVGPLVLTFMVTGVTGAVVLVDVVGRSDALLRAIVDVGGGIGLGAHALFALIQLAGFAALAAVGWATLKWIGRRYERKATSDQRLTLDALWLLFGVTQSITLTFEGWPWIFTGVVAFAAYTLVTRIGFALTRPRAAAARAPMLLLLRVFALGRKSEPLFDALAKRWLRGGSLGLVAGPDLVTLTVEPHEFLEFVGGRLSRQFVRDVDDLERRLARLDLAPDPDGRYRVNEFFCHDDTWRPTMQAVAARSDAVLMDLRGFSAANQGCVYELGQLLAAVDLTRVVFVADRTTDRAFLDSTLDRLWHQTPGDSPNLKSGAPTVRVFPVDRLSPAVLGALLRTLTAARV